MSTTAPTQRPGGSRQTFQTKYGPWAVATGASDGIGKDIATELARRGLNVVLVARRQDRMDALASELAKQYGVQTKVIAADLGRQSGIEATLTETRTLDVGLLVAAAGCGTSGLFTDLALEQELDMIDVNCRAVVALTHHFAGRFVGRGHGGVILLSSLLAFQGVPRAATYAATKAFIQTFAEGLRLELAPRGVDVIASAPGPVRSGFNDRANMQTGMGVGSMTVARQTIGALGRQGMVRPGALSKLLEASLVPLPRVGRSRILGVVMGGMTRHQIR